MGLDMSLYANKFVNGYSHAAPSELEEYAAVCKALGVTPTPESPCFMVEISVAYWRKANAIHGWFVANCQNGVDECQKAHVDRQSIIDLRDLCSEVMDEPERAEELLPLAAGPFFGAVEYDDSYYYDIRDTYDKLGRILTDPTLADLDFTYQSSW